MSNDKYYILVYEVNTYAECGGGTYFEEFETDTQLDERVNEVATGRKNSVTIKLAARISRRYDYKPVDVITRWVRN